MKKQSNLSRLLDYAGKYRILTYLSWMFSAVSALLALVPFWYIWRILKEIIEVAPRYENAVHVTQYGWMAVAAAIASAVGVHHRADVFASCGISDCHQFAPFHDESRRGASAGCNRTVWKRQTAPNHFRDCRGHGNVSGAPTAGQGEGDGNDCRSVGIAPDFDWRLGLLSLVPVALAFLVMTRMTGRKCRSG